MLSGGETRTDSESDTTPRSEPDSAPPLLDYVPADPEANRWTPGKLYNLIFVGFCAGIYLSAIVIALLLIAWRASLGGTPAEVPQLGLEFERGGLAVLTLFLGSMQAVAIRAAMHVLRRPGVPRLPQNHLVHCIVGGFANNAVVFLTLFLMLSRLPTFSHGKEYFKTVATVIAVVTFYSFLTTLLLRPKMRNGVPGDGGTHT